MSVSMRAAAIDAFGLPEVLTVRSMRRPDPQEDEVLVRVMAAGVQRTDAAIRSGWTPPGATIQFPQILGNEFAGVIEKVGAGITGFASGDAVLGFRVLDCYAEYVAVPASQIVPKPGGMPWEEAGALSASGQTAHTAIEALGIGEGDTVLVHGAAGGVGTIFTQLAVWAGARVVGTAGAANQDYVRALGADPVVYGDGQLDRIRALAPAVDVAFDAAGHDNLRDAIHLVEDRRRVATIVDMQLAGELRCRVIRSQRSAERLATLAALTGAARLRVHVRRIYALDEVADAHREVETGHGRGKVVLSIGDAR
ncbi:NADP-dependent oxidoreductase [Agrococcus versicolor]|uniref:NADP-dependent oxidoreductase n=1 Tax=Agrococcus versicolor TaxID=501482 RepID=A0ABP5M8R7_9MICO